MDLHVGEGETHNPSENSHHKHVFLEGSGDRDQAVWTGLWHSLGLSHVRAGVECCGDSGLYPLWCFIGGPVPVCVCVCVCVYKCVDVCVCVCVCVFCV